MDQITAAQRLLRELAGPRLAGDPIKAVIGRLSRQLGFGYSRTYEIWYGRAPLLHQSEIDQLAEAFEKKRRMEARNELAELRARVARLESMYRTTDPDFFSEEITALRNSTLRID